MTYRRIESDELGRVAEVVGQSFRFDGARFHQMMVEGRHRYTHENARVLTESSEIVAALFAFQREVTVQGCFVPVGLVGLVSVPPEQRRRGYAFRLMHGLLEEWRVEGIALSLLYPYDIEFYRRLGYGIVNEAWYLELPLDQMEVPPAERDVRRLAEAALPAMQALFEAQRPRHNGWLSRTEGEWRERLLRLSDEEPWPRKREAVGVPDGAGGLSGYLVYTMARIENPPSRGGPTPVELHVHEWVSADDGAWRALAGFVAAQRAQADFVRYTAPAGFPLPYTVRNRRTYRDLRQTEFVYRDMFSVTAGLMGRPVDWARALTQRGWPEKVSGSCVVQVEDRLLPANEHPLQLTVTNGRATTQPTGEPPSARADALTWGELYAGTLRPRRARLLGRLAADDETLDFLTRALATAPWFLPSADWF